jgi:predicted RNase H-like HicB family nuclease
MTNTFTGVFEQVEDCYVGYAEELPGANIQEKTLEEARESLREAIELVLWANRKQAEEKNDGKNIVREKITVQI